MIWWLWVSCFMDTNCLSGSRGQYTVTQTPTKTTVTAGQIVTLNCKTSANVDGDCSSSRNQQCQAWYLQKPENTPKALTGVGNSRLSGTPSRFSAAGSGRDFTLTITGVQAEDAGVYHCWTDSCVHGCAITHDELSIQFSLRRLNRRQGRPCGTEVFVRRFNQAASLWYTFGGGTKLIVKTGVSVPPSLALLPPSAKQLKDESTATLVCLLSGYSPQGATVSWTVDGRAVTNGVVTGEEVEKDGGKSARSSTLTLSKALWEQGELYSCKASHDGRETAAELRRTECRV
ncbi:immunoglobulin kappa light chain-like [Myripristis murdjan]|uniref:immunoglobulin kappa light chain-like n=1 Tax=Myripristis murdjan TaxID=586833 RepID=UPI001176014F|nr:immunoglobulin kappa light chain-like [Myripristis murdjan]